MSFTAAQDRLAALGAELAAPNAPRRKFDLAHMRTLVRALGSPQLQFRSVLIAGTNGKGSTAATLAHILAAAGLRTALYTSPHLIRVTERIRTNTTSIPSTDLSFRPEREARSGETRITAPAQSQGPTTLEEIPEPTFARLFFQVDETARALVAQNHLPHPPSYFETLTALAFLHFAEQHIDLAVLEVGLGGRLDATNIVDPLLSVITDIALDHQDYLGPTLRDIAREKAGILRPNGILITLPQHPQANQSIGEAAVPLNVRAINAADYLPTRTFPTTTATPTSSTFVIPQGDLPHPTPNLVIPQGDPLHPTPNLVIPQGDPLHPTSASGISENVSFRPERSEVEKPASAPAQGPGAPFTTQPHRVVNGIEPGPHPPTDTPQPLPPNTYTLHIDRQPLRVHSPLPGEHQQRNLALAIAAAVELRTHHNLPIPNAAIESGIAHTSWPGRLEFLPPNLLLDVAHNPAGAWTLRAALARLPDSQPRTLLFSCLRDKDLREIAQILFPLFDSPTIPVAKEVSFRPEREARSGETWGPRRARPLGWQTCITAPAQTPAPPQHHLILTPIDNPRAATLDQLALAAAALDIPALTAPNPAQALALARRITPPGGLIVATGSVYLIGALRNLVTTT